MADHLDGNMQGKVIADHEDYRITLHQVGLAPTNRIGITFGGQPTGLSNTGFGTEFFAGLGWDSLYVAQRSGSQYQGLSLDSFQATVRPVLEDRADVVCYGSSLGGYAALYYGGVINARILAAAPMLPAWPPLKNSSYCDFELSHAELVATPRTNHSPVAIFDPQRDQDSVVIDNMVRPHYPDLRSILVPYGGHAVLIALARAKLLKSIVIAFLERDEVLSFEPPGEGTAIYHGEYGLKIRMSQGHHAADQLEKSIRLAPSKRYFNELIKHLIKMGDLQRAQQVLDEAMRSKEKKHCLLHATAQYALSAGLTLTDT